MKYLIPVICLVLVLLMQPARAARIECPKYTLRLEGETGMPTGGSFKEIVEMHKVGMSEGYEGKWKVDRLVLALTLSKQAPFVPDDFGPVEFGQGMGMTDCSGTRRGNTQWYECTGGNLHMDVVGDRIGSIKNDTWIGRIKGDEVTLKFYEPNPFEPTLKGRIRKPEARELSLKIIDPEPEARFCYSEDTPGVLELVLTAQGAPASYEQEIKWSLPEIEGVEQKIYPSSALGPTVRVEYIGMPKKNSDFGWKTVSAELKIGGCRISEERKIRFYYPLTAQNNPGGQSPNWFYYWQQTPAAQPRGQNINVEYGGNFFNLCQNPDVPAQFTEGYGHATVHVCDLSRLGSTFANRVPLLDVNKPYLQGWTKTHYIDTFASAVRHEYTHWLCWFNYRNRRNSAEMADEDQDQDGLPDAMEPELGFDPAKTQTYLADHPELKHITWDEEYLCFMEMMKVPFDQLKEYDWARPGKQWP
ncbi:MAG: hypothetical protein ACLFUN_04920 [Desulfobacterales bacterium]